MILLRTHSLKNTHMAAMAVPVPKMARNAGPLLWSGRVVIVLMDVFSSCGGSYRMRAANIQAFATVHGRRIGCDAGVIMRVMQER